MSYHKTIKYLDYCEEGKRLKNAGVWKVEQRDGTIAMEVILRDLPYGKETQKDVILQTAGQELLLGKMKLVGGNGVFTCRWDESPEKQEEWEKIIVPLDEDCYVVGIWQAQRERAKKKETEEVSMEGDELEAEAIPLDAENVSEDVNVLNMINAQNKIAEEKWQHLWGIYPHIKPYGDDREYLSVRPADFLIFQEESYRKVNNSFLMHGYYNYGHLILARIRRQAEYAYYVGAPGSFFEREKQVAIMFGFESFECEKEPAQAGDFGYYMMRVRL